MAAIDYEAIKAKALQVITDAGQTVEFTRQENAGGLDNRGDTIAPSPKHRIKGQGVKTNYKNIEIDGTNILTTDAKFIFSGEEELKAGDLTTLGGIDWRVNNINSIEPAAVKIISIVQLRKA